MSLINTEIKPFKATAFHNGEFVDVTDADLKGKWSVVFFYPADFTFVCPTELGDLADNYAEFQRSASRSTRSRPTPTSPTRRGTTLRHHRQDPVPDGRRPDRQLSRELRRAARRPGPGRPRHVPGRPRRRDPARRDHRRGHRPQRRRAAAQGQGRAVRPRRTRTRSARPSGKRATTPSPPRSTSSARSDRSAARAGLRSTPPLVALPRHDRPRASTPSSPWPVEHRMLDAALTAQLKTHFEKITRPIELVASLDDSPKSARARRRCSTSSPRCPTRSPSCARDDDERRPSFAIRRAGTDVDGALRRHPARPRAHLARARPPPGRRPPVDGRAEAASSRSSDLEGDYALRDLLLALAARTAPTWCRRSTS